MSDTASHGALMDTLYRQQRHIYDLTREYYLLGRDRLVAELAPPQGGSVLEVACGTGRNLARVAKSRPDVQLYGFDISEEMLITARAKMSKKGLGDRITLAQGDATGFDPQTLFGVEKFDAIFQSYCLSMIPNWRGAVTEAAHHLAPGGQLSVVDFGDQADLPRWLRHGLQNWILAPFHVTPRLELAEAMDQAAESIGGSAQIISLKGDYCRYAVLRAPG